MGNSWQFVLFVGKMLFSCMHLFRRDFQSVQSFDPQKETGLRYPPSTPAFVRIRVIGGPPDFFPLASNLPEFFPRITRMNTNQSRCDFQIGRGSNLKIFLPRKSVNLAGARAGLRSHSTWPAGWKPPQIHCSKEGPVRETPTSGGRQSLCCSK